MYLHYPNVSKKCQTQRNPVLFTVRVCYIACQWRHMLFTSEETYFDKWPMPVSRQVIFLIFFWSKGTMPSTISCFPFAEKLFHYLKWVKLYFNVRLHATYIDSLFISTSLSYKHTDNGPSMNSSSCLCPVQIKTWSCTGGQIIVGFSPQRRRLAKVLNRNNPMATNQYEK